MSYNQDPTGKRSNRLSPDQLAQEVAKLLKKDTPGTGRRLPRFDVVSVSRIVLALGIVFVGLGTAFAVSLVGRLGDYETTGSVLSETPVFGCPGEPESGALFIGETVRVIGLSDDGDFYALRDERGPGDVAYADAAVIGAVEAPDRLTARSCEPRSAAQVLAAATSADATTSVPSTVSTTTTIAPGTTIDSSTTTVPPGRPPRRGTSGPGTNTTTTVPAGPGSPSTTGPSPSPTTSLPGATSSTTGHGSTTTTRAGTTTTSTTTTTSITTTTSTTTTTTPTTTTEPPSTTTTTTEPSTTTTETPTTTTSPTLP
ncbi:MAG: hypothetical protein ACRDX9_18125 [Acidimicrobiia bacterium]